MVGRTVDWMDGRLAGCIGYCGGSGWEMDSFLYLISRYASEWETVVGRVGGDVLIFIFDI